MNTPRIAHFAAAIVLALAGGCTAPLVGDNAEASSGLFNRPPITTLPPARPTVACQVDCGTAAYSFIWNSQTCTFGPPDSVSCSGYNVSNDGLDHMKELFDEMKQQRCEGAGVCTGQALSSKCCKNVCVSSFSSC